MAGLTPFNPWKTGLSPRNMFNIMDDFFNDTWLLSHPSTVDTFKVDVQESDCAYTIDAEMPGVRKEEISLSLNEGRLTISVERNEEVKNDKDNYIHRERRYSSMQRSVYLANAADDGVDASLTDGILNIVVPKKTKADITRKIEIK